jgi:hypothetical protein
MRRTPSGKVASVTDHDRSLHAKSHPRTVVHYPYQSAIEREERYWNSGEERYEKNRRGRKVLHEGHDADLVEETPTRREWVSRVSGEIEREKLVNGRWEMEK